MAQRETTIIRAGDAAIGGGGARGYVDWGAIFAGTAVAGGVSVVLTGFATALGLGSISAEPDGNMISGWGVALTGLFTVIAMVAAYMLGGYIAGRMRRRVEGAPRDEITARDGIHGLVVWSLGMILAGILAMGAVSSGVRAVGSAASTAVEAAGTAVGGVAQGAGQLAGGVVSGVGQAVGGVVQGAGDAVAPTLQDMLPEGLTSNPLDYIGDRMLRPAVPQPGAAPAGANAAEGDAVRAEIASILANLVRTGEIPEADRAYLRNVIATRTGLSPTEVEARASEAIQSAQALRAEAEQRLEAAKAEAQRLAQEAEQAAEQAAQEAIEAAEAAREAAILSAFLLAASALVAAVAAYIGAVKGGRHRDEEVLWGGLRYHR